MGGKSEAPPPTQEVKRILSPQQEETLGYAMPAIRSFAASTPTREGVRVAGFTDPQVQGQQMALGAAPTQQGLATSGANLSNYFLNPEALNVNRDPVIRSAIDASVRPITQQFTESILPELRSGSIASGPYGGSRLGVSQGLAAGRTAQAIGDTASKVALQAQEANMRGQLQALGLLPQTLQAQVAPATTVSGVGDVQQAQRQAELSDYFASKDFNQYADLFKARELAGLVGAIPGGSTVATGSVAPAPSNLQKALGGAAAGAGLGSAFGPIGTGVGALGGAVLPFFF